ncbi:MAG: ABC transporter permease [Rhodospirillales bacterium]|nr:ABC transporter permease [Rhodospirillales bacterium]
MAEPVRLGYASATRWFLAAAAVALLAADMTVSALDPGAEMRRLLAGILWPDWAAIAGRSVVLTVAFAVLGVALGASAGLLLALLFHRFGAVRALAAALRSVHELFWALLLMQLTGISPVTGILAIAIPYAGIFAKVFSEIIEEADLSADRVLPSGTGVVSRFAYARIPVLAGPFGTYLLYRLECGMRSTLVLGFIGLPTMGFELESYFRQGRYAEAAAFVAVFYVLIGTRRLWVRPATLPFLIVGSLFALIWLTEPLHGDSLWQNLARFLGNDVVPRPLRGADLTDLATWSALFAWLLPILRDQALPGLVNTLVLSQVALVASGILALILFPLVCRHFAGIAARPLGRVLLVVMRSTPEYMLAYVLLQTLGPSMLPAAVALALHNGGIIGYLLGRHADALSYRADAPRGLNLYLFETVPRLYGQFLAYALYRWEIIVRESAIFGILGVLTLGYYIDAAIAELRLDTAVVLIATTGLLSLGIDALSRGLRRRLRIEDRPVRLSVAPTPATGPQACA